jgi:PAS domain S-box-containing protein
MKEISLDLNRSIEPPAVRRSAPTPKSVHVLVVDDDVIDRMAVRRALARSGVDVNIDEATGAVDALSTVPRSDYDCVFLDYHLGDGNGLSVLRGIRGAGLDVPVVMLTSQGDEAVAVELMKAGAADYIVKSALTPEHVGRSLLYAVSLGQAQEAAKQAQAELRATAERLRLATTSADIGTWDMNLASGAMVWDDRCRAILGIPREASFLSGDLFSAVHPEDRERLQRVRHHSLDPSGDGHFEVETRIVDGDGTVRWIDARGRALFSDASDSRRATRFIGTVLDITDRKRAEESLREDARLIETLHNIGSSLASDLDVGHIVQTVTDEGTKVVGARFGVFCQFVPDNGTPRIRYTLSGIARESPTEVAAEAEDELREESVREVIRVDDVRSDPGRVSLPPQLGWGEGQLPTASCLAVPVIGHSGELLATLFLGHPEPGMFNERHERLVTGLAGWAAVAMDNARLYEAEQRARGQAERANRTKAEFLSSMSHDLRAPLNAVAGYAQLTLDGIYGPTTEKMREGMQRILRAEQHLLAIIRDILDFARIEAGHIRLDMSDVAVNEVLAGVGVMIEPQMTAKGLEYECRKGAPEIALHTDRERAVQILLNLLTNALKFTDKGSVKVDWDADDNSISINVRDTGRGIPDDRVSQIFEPFVQVGRDPNEARQGIGLGLAISRQLARNMGGDLRAESVEGQGSVFTVELPRSELKTTSS